MTLTSIQRARLRVDNKTGLKGVSAYGTRWRACIRVDGRNQHLGLYDSPEAAARAYDAAAIDVYGPTAWTNADHGNLRGRP